MSNDLVVTKANSFVEASYQMTLDEMRVLALTLGVFDPLNPKMGFDLTVSDFCDNFPEVNPDIAYVQVQNAIRKISKRWMTLVDNEKELTEVAFVTKRTYFKQEGRFYIEFHQDLKPYITNLKNRYTKYELVHIGAFTSTHAIRLYELMAQYKNSREKSRDITLENLKEWLQIADKYPEVRDFKKRVLTPAINEINAKSDLLVSYEPIKSGRKITGLHFKIKVKKSKLTPPKYPPRPHVRAGSHEEGVYFRACIAQFNAWCAKNELTLTQVSDDVLKQHYKHARPLGDAWIYIPVREELERRGISASYNSFDFKVTFGEIKK